MTPRCRLPRGCVFAATVDPVGGASGGWNLAEEAKGTQVRIQWGTRICRTLASVSPTLSALRFLVFYMSSLMGAAGMFAAGGAWSGFALGATGILSLHPAVPPHPICMPPDAFTPI